MLADAVHDPEPRPHAPLEHPQPVEPEMPSKEDDDLLSDLDEGPLEA